MDTSAPSTLVQLLEKAASDPRDCAISVYTPGNVSKVAKRLTYRELLYNASTNAPVLQQLPGISKNTVFLLHFDNHLDGFQWLWSVIAAGYVPAVSTPFTQDLDQRRKHLRHLKHLFNDPVIVTRSHLVSDFAGLDDELDIRTIEVLIGSTVISCPGRASTASSDELALLMLTSGSTGHAKAVELRHGQLIQAVTGKSLYHKTHPEDSFLNWIGLDHVANLTEIHLHAMALAAEQVHVNAADLLTDPMIFLHLIDRHQISYTFAPNFFLASLKKAVERRVDHLLDSKNEINLNSLRALISGGEANVTETCNVVTQLLQRYGAPSSFVRPGFGMTETCAGSIYNKECPAYDIYRKLEFTSLGSSIPGLEFRVTRDDHSLATVQELGNLEVAGPILFKAYYNNDKATQEAFTSDGWFKTGDRAFIDGDGYLNLSGRAKDSIIINGVKYFPHEIEAAIEDAGIHGVVPSFTVVFPHRPKGYSTEVICIVYLPSYHIDDLDSRMETRNAMLGVVVRHCATRPYRILPLGRDAFSKTSLGKLSRAKFRTAFESGALKTYEEVDSICVQRWQQVHFQKASTETESVIIEVFSDVLELSEDEISVNTSVFELGISSVEVLRLKMAIEQALMLQNPTAISTIISNPTAKSLAIALQDSEEKVYNPTVTISSRGSAKPLWLVHPGVGEILIFLRLAHYITDRPVHALRSRGFDGEPFFQSVAECVSVYYDAIKQVQPEGPYAILGYSYGATLTFELTKLFETRGDIVKFTGLIDQPPYIQARMHVSDWNSVLVTLATLLEIISPEQSKALRPLLAGLSKDEAVERVLSMTTWAHLQKMALDKPKLTNWAELALNNHQIARKYEPSGTVSCMDVFYGEVPVAFYAKSGPEMREKHLGRWQDFVASEVSFHPVQGTHDDMLQRTHASSFYKSLKAALQNRDV